MALPPKPAVTENPPQPDPGMEAADAPMPGAEDGMEDEGGWQPFVTVMKNADTGAFMLVKGDEPEPEDGEEPTGPTFDTPQALMRGVMEMLNSDGGAEESFGKGFRGEPDAMSAPPAKLGAPMPK